ncbi:MAG: hypothetical protein ACPLRY_01240 [Candidatus Bathyarchaeales archaeon]
MSIIQKPEQELPLEEILRWTFIIYSKNFITFFIPFLAAAIVTGSLGSIVTNFATQATANIPEPGASSEEIQNWFLSFMMAFLAMTFVLAIMSWIISTVVNGIGVKCTTDLIEKGKASLTEAFNFTVYKLVSLLAAALITGILIGLGLLALIIIGIIVMIMFSMVVPAIIIEDIGALDSLSRSRKLVSYRWLKTFALLLIIYLAVFFVSFVGSLVGQHLGPFSILVGSIIGAFIQPIIPISLTVYYYAMVAKEAKRAPPPPPPPF